MIRISLAALAAASLFLMPAMVSAHVTLDAGEAPAGGFFRAVLRVPHGCDGSPTTGIRVQIPDDVLQAKPMPKPGWQLTVKKEKLKQPYNWYGTQVTEDVREISWSGGNLDDAFYDEFIFRVKMPEKEGQVLRFPVIQTCAKGQSKWIEIPAAGADEDSVEFPAPTLTLGKKGGDDD